MSAPVRLHEPVCFDNMQNQFFWIDHFLGDQIKDEWTGAGAGGSVVVVDQQAGGIARLSTGATTGNNYRIEWGDIRSLLVTKRVSFELRANISTITNIRIRHFLRFDWDNCIFFNYDSGVGANWGIYCRDGGLQTSGDSGIAADASYHRFRIQCEIEGGSHVHFYIDNVQCGNSPITTNVPDDAGDYLQPYPRIETLEDLAKSTDIDYVVVRQDI